MSKEFSPLTRASPESSLRSLDTKSSTNWSSFDGLVDPLDEVVDDDEELGNEPVIMAADDVDFLSPSETRGEKLAPMTKFLDDKIMTKNLTSERGNVANYRHEHGSWSTGFPCFLS